MQWVLAVLGTCVLCGGLACASSPQGVVMNRFIPDEKLASVRICETTGRQLVDSLGAPAGQGRDGDMGTLSWNAVAVVSDSDQTAVGTQSVHAWVDSDGLVAGFVVNPAGFPQRPARCSEQRPGQDPDPAPAAAEKPKEARMPTLRAELLPDLN